MSSEQVKFKVGESAISGILETPNTETTKVVLVLHPHPLHGGDVFNPVVQALVDTFLDAGYATFRFNFRGTKNRSDFAQVSGAVDDTRAASKILDSLGFKLVGIAGYSFGGTTALQFSSVSNVEFVVSVSSSLNLFQDGRFEMNNLSQITCPVLMFHGTSDMTVPYDNMTKISSEIDGEVKCVSIQNEGHFYHHSLTQVQNELKLFMKTMGF